jgi:hypothetical protein
MTQMENTRGRIGFQFDSAADARMARALYEKLNLGGYFVLMGNKKFLISDKDSELFYQRLQKHEIPYSTFPVEPMIRLFNEEPTTADRSAIIALLRSRLRGRLVR